MIKEDAMCLEEDFDIQIKDSELEKLQTVDDVIILVLKNT